MLARPRCLFSVLGFAGLTRYDSVLLFVVLFGFYCFTHSKLKFIGFTVSRFYTFSVQQSFTLGFTLFLLVFSCRTVCFTVLPFSVLAEILEVPNWTRVALFVLLAFNALPKLLGCSSSSSVWVKIKPPGIGPQVLAFGSISRASRFGSSFLLSPLPPLRACKARQLV